MRYIEFDYSINDAPLNKIGMLGKFRDVNELIFSILQVIFDEFDDAVY